MNRLNPLHSLLLSSQNPYASKSIWERLHIDVPLLVGLLILIGLGLVILYSAGDQNMGILLRQVSRVALAFGILFVFAQIPPQKLQNWALGLFIVGLIFLLAVLISGHIGKGARRWLDLGLLRFQPSEMMKLAIPMLLAWYLSDKPLPPQLKTVAICGLIIVVPVLITAKQPDLGTALMLALAGACVLFLAGLRWSFIIVSLILASAAAPLAWHFMHDYQRQRVLTFLNPEQDPLGSGYHIIQSKIAIGSGGVSGKGWLNGTQAYLDFLPEHSTDFIFAVCGEEFGLIGGIILLLSYLFVAFRGLYLSTQAQDTFGRLLSGSLALTFFFSTFINIGMVSGILPVVGIPLPLISYGGTSMVTFMASFGIMMSINNHRKLLAK